MENKPIKRLAIVTTHPIQYNAPLFTMLAERQRIAVKVFYTWGEDVLQNKYDPGFNKAIEWDIPLLKGYEYMFPDNIALNKGSHHYKGIDNPGLISEIQKWNADAILVYGWSFKSHLKVMRYFHGKIPVLFRGDSVALQRMPGLKRLLRLCVLKWVYRYVDFALYVGTNNKHYFKAYGLKENQVIFAPHAIDNERFRAGSSNIHLKEMDLWKQLPGISTAGMIFLYAGKIDENKNVHLLAAAFTMLNKQDVHLIIAGDGLNKMQLQKKYEDNINIHFLPFQNQSQMPLLYGLADVFVLPSLSETWGLVINEAMACAKAVLVSSGCGAAVDLVKSGDNGYIFKSNNLVDLHNKLLSLVCDTEKVKEMGVRSGILIKKWNYHTTCEAIERLLT